MNAAPRRSGLVGPALAALAGFAILIGLGTWQVERLSWKEALIASVTRQFDAPPQPLPPPRSWTTLDPGAAEFRRVTFRATFAVPEVPSPSDREARLYAAGSALRDDIKGPGYFVFAPAKLPDGRVVVVNRGYVPDLTPNAKTAAMAAPEEPIDVVGVMRWPSTAGWFDTTYSPTGDLWFVRDHLKMAAQKDWGPVPPFYIDMEEPVPAGGLPRPGRLRVNLPNSHLQYAITWYGLALALAAFFVVWLRSRRRDAVAGPA
jgi:surfeit locus 1 family protein